MTTKASILQTIRQKCLDCCCGQQGEVRLCHIEACALWPYRFGRDPLPSSNRGFAGQSGGTNGPSSGSPAMASSPRLGASPEKPHVYTRGSSRGPTGMGPDSAPTRLHEESSVYTGDFEQGEHLQPLPSIAESAR